MTDQIYLHEFRDGVVPLGPGSDRDLGFQERAEPGVGPAARRFSMSQLEPLTVRTKERRLFNNNGLLNNLRPHVRCLRMLALPPKADPKRSGQENKP